MKKINPKSVNEVLNIVFKGSSYICVKFDGRKRETKKILSLFSIEQLKKIEAKRIQRYSSKLIEEFEPVKCLSKEIEFQRNAPENYKKMLIVGTNNIWLASINHGLNDYNKTIFFENNETNRKKANLINSLILK